MDENEARGVKVFASIMLGSITILLVFCAICEYETMMSRERIFTECIKDKPLCDCAIYSRSVAE